MRTHSLALAVTALSMATVPVLAQPLRPAAGATQGVDSFARSAAETHLAQVMLSAMALQKTRDKRVQDFAWTMLDHHSRALGDLSESLGARSTALPIAPSAEQQAVLERMRGLDGTAFDSAYLDYQVDANGRSASLYETGARLEDQAVAGNARATLPIVQAHRTIAETKRGEPADPIAE